MATLIDAHQLGQGQTGNETWARNVVREIGSRSSGSHVAVTAAGLPFVKGWPSTRVHQVSASSTRRLMYDLPKVTRKLRPEALLAQYTLPTLSDSVRGVVVVHDLSFERAEAKNWIPASSLARYRATIRRSVSKAAAVLVPTEWTRQDVIERYGVPADNVFVAGNALDPNLAARLASADRDRLRTGQTILCVGTVLPRKNLEVAARAVATLRDRGQDVRLRLVGPVPRSGGTPTAQALRSILGDAIDIIGEVSQTQLAHEYVSADALAFPSLFEGFGIPIIEAMAAGIPVVCSDATCLPEVGGDAVLYASPTDDEAWVEALSSVLNDVSVHDRLVAAGGARATTYRWEHTADVVEATLAGVAA